MKVTYEEKSVNELITKLKAKYPVLTNEDFKIINNNVTSMLTMVAYRLRKSKEEMTEILKNL